MQPRTRVLNIIGMIMVIWLMVGGMIMLISAICGGNFDRMWK